MNKTIQKHIKRKLSNWISSLSKELISELLEDKLIRDNQEGEVEEYIEGLTSKAVKAIK